MGNVIYLELSSSHVQDIIEAMTEQIEQLKRSEDYYKDKYEKVETENAKLKSELKEMTNRYEAAVAAKTEKEEL